MAIGSPQWMYKSGEAYEIDQSLKLDSASVANLQFTPSSASNRKTWTLSFWCKVGDIASGEQSIFTAGTSCTDRLGVMLDGSNHLSFNVCGVGDVIETQAVYRDPSAWLHCVFVLDTTQSTSTDRGKIYVNGEAVALTHNSSLTLNKDYTINNNTLHAIGALSNAVTSASYTFGGYLGEMHFIDGQTLTPADFGETGTYGEWKPIEYSGTYGTNGFYLNFAGGGVMSATGGTITTDGDYKVHSFTADGTFTPSADGYVEYLVIAGGGGGGSADDDNGYSSGGGGAGGYRTGYLPVTAQGYSITVGAGGAGGTGHSSNGTQGENSVFSTITSIGGGYGGTANSDGGAGGSGGGGGVGFGDNARSGGSATSGQGNDGGGGLAKNNGNRRDPSGGGGGAGAVGQTGSGSTGGNGGDGLASSITGSSVTRAGGGAGDAQTGGSGGGGSGRNDGAANTGSGGGGSSNGTNHGGAAGHNYGDGGSGGSGIVIIRYKFQ